MTRVRQLREEIAAQAAVAGAELAQWRASLQRSRRSGTALLTSPRALAAAFGAGFAVSWLSRRRHRSSAGSAVRYAAGLLQPMVLSAAAAWWQSRQQVEKELEEHARRPTETGLQP